MQHNLTEEDDEMFEQRQNRGNRGLFAKILLTSAFTSLAVSLLVYAFTSGYIGGEPAPEGDRLNRTLQLSQAGSLPAATSQSDPNAASQTKKNSLIDTLSGSSTAAQNVARQATPGVVGITVERVQQKSLFNRNDGTEVGVGSGVVVSSDGYILTNNHVAGGYSKRIVVSFADGRNVDGSVVWADPVLDLAAVKVNLTGLTPLKLGDASKLEVGETAIAIGNPLGLEFQRTVTSGIISALNRTIKIDTETGPNYMEDLIQTDASINPGNSGGPLLNAKGEVIGINTVKVTSAEAMGFAIPINICKPIAQKLVSTGSFKEPYMGLFAYDNSVLPYMGENLGTQSGIYVAYVDESGPAFQAGIKEGCIISQVDGQDINTMLQLRTHVYSKNPGDTIRVTHLDHNTNQWATVPVVLGQKTKDGLITR
jgi:S1-C subfamily serine protease